MSEKLPRRAGWSGAKGAVAGFIVGVLFSGAGLFPEFAKRLAWANGGGGGESADWGQPLFHMVILSILAGLIGAIVGAAVGRSQSWKGKRR